MVQRKAWDLILTFHWNGSCTTVKGKTVLTKKLLFADLSLVQVGLDLRVSKTELPFEKMLVHV